MKVKILSALLSALLVAMVIAPQSASASTTSKQPARNNVLCALNNKAQNATFQQFNQNNRWQVSWLQWLVSSKNQLRCTVNKNTVDTLVANGNFKTLVAAVGAAGLADTLATANATVFAPTDQAFAKLPAGTVEALLADIPTLTSILTYHVVGGTVPSSVARTLTSAETLNGQEITISKKGRNLFINDSRVVITDIKTTNGIIHVIDTVLIPS